MISKPGMAVDRDAPIELQGQLPYVSRGGLKIEAALDSFGIDPAGAVAADFGASTGGFTDCLLQRGARKVYAYRRGATVNWHGPSGKTSGSWSWNASTYAIWMLCRNWSIW